MARIHHLGHIFVALWGLLRDEFGRGYANGDPLVSESLKNILIIQRTPSGLSTVANLDLPLESALPAP